MFPWVGVGVGKTDGAALVWWNLLASHEHDFLTRRADCPVVLGHKTGEAFVCLSVSPFDLLIRPLLRLRRTLPN